MPCLHSLPILWQPKIALMAVQRKIFSIIIKTFLFISWFNLNSHWRVRFLILCQESNTFAPQVAQEQVNLTYQNQQIISSQRIHLSENKMQNTVAYLSAVICLFTIPTNCFLVQLKICICYGQSFNSFLYILRGLKFRFELLKFHRLFCDDVQT